MDSKRMKVLCPISTKDEKKTVWKNLGIAFENKDGSINVYLDVLPLNGKLQLREFDDDDRRVGEGTRFQSRVGSGFDGGPASASANAELPF
jgi:hypothetical protein